MYPCLWLAELKDINWVAVGTEERTSEKPREENLSDYLKRLAPRLLKDNTNAQDFLERHFGFGRLELVGWTLTGGQPEAEQKLISGLSEISKIASEEGKDFTEIMTELLSEAQRREERSKISQRNQALGVIIETTVRSVFEQLRYKEFGFEVIPHWEAYDFDAILERKLIEEYDYRRLSLEVLQSRSLIADFKVEVKATRKGFVEVTFSQAQEASRSPDGKYLICFVPLNELQIEFEKIADVAEEKLVEVAQQIGPRIIITDVAGDFSSIFRGLEQTKLSAAASEIRISFANARFLLPSDYWNRKGHSLSQWFDSTLRRLGLT